MAAAWAAWQKLAQPNALSAVDSLHKTTLISLLFLQSEKGCSAPVEGLFSPPELLHNSLRNTCLSTIHPALAVGHLTKCGYPFFR